MTDTKRYVLRNPSKTCSIEGCNKPMLARSWCKIHYDRWRRHGDPNTRLTNYTIRGGGKVFFEEVVNSDSNDCILWPFGNDGRGYGLMYVGGKTRLAHREVCKRVHGPPPTSKYDAAHDNFGKPCISPLCVNPKHLRWATRKENHSDKYKHGTHIQGAKHVLAKLNDDQVCEIYSMRGGASMRDVARLFGVSVTTIFEIQHGKRWAWLTRPDK